MTQTDDNKLSEFSRSDSSEGELLASEPVLCCSVVRDTLQYYRDVLGFSHLWYQGKPSSFGGVSRGGAHVSFFKASNSEQVWFGHKVFFHVKNLDFLYREHFVKGADVISPILKLPNGTREYVVQDLNGYHLHFRENVSN